MTDLFPRRIRAVLATLLVLALDTCIPRAAHAVSFVQFATRCADNDTLGSFIELTGGQGESTRNGMRLRAYDRNGVVLFDMDAYGSRGGQVFTFQEGLRRFLLATSALIEQVGFIWGGPPLGYADNILPTALDEVAGRLQLYLNVNGREQTSAQIRYGPGQLPAPPPGMSTALGPGGWLVEPRPKLQSFFNSANPVSAPLCFSAAEYHIRTLRLQCEDGGTRGQCLEIDGLGPIGRLHERVSMRAFDHAGTLIGTADDAFASDSSAMAFSSRHWLMAARDFTPAGSDTADARLPFTLDPAGGSLNLIVTVSGISYSIDVFTYGTASVPLPAPGFSYTRTSGVSVGRQVVIPTNSGGAPVEILDCAAGLGVARAIVQEIALECTDGRPQGQFVELGARGAALPIDTGYHLRAFRRDGSLEFDLQDVFKGLPAVELARDRAWLLIPASDVRANLADATLPDTLDRVAGALELWHSTAIGDSLALRFEWGLPPLVRPVAGGSIEGTTLTLTPIAYPTPTTYARVALPHDDCTSNRDIVALSVLRLGLDCADGSRTAAFVELDRLGMSQVRNTRLGLRWLANNGRELARVEPLFPPRPEWSLNAQPHWLVAAPGFAARIGLAPDREWAEPFGETPAIVELYRRDPLTQALTAMGAHAIQSALLAPGRTEVRLGESSYETASTVSPQRFDGARAAAGSCWFPPHPEAVRLSALFLRCRTGDAGGQYVQLAASGGESVYSNDLLLRLLDHTGLVLGELRAPFPPSYAERAWPRDRALLLGGAAFTATLGASPDATLPAALDTTGGRVELLLAPSGQREVLLDALDYGPGGIAIPAPGAALVSDNGVWREEELPRANGINIALAAPTSCLGECPGRTVRFAVGGEQAVTSRTGRETAAGAEFTYDSGRGTFALISTFGDLVVRWDDRYVVEGVAPGTPVTLTARVRNALASDDTCLRAPVVCITSLASVVLLQGMQTDSIAASHAPRAVQLPITVPAGEAFDLTLSLRANAIASPLLPASTRARIEFSGLAHGVRVRSCNGFDSRLQRWIGNPVVDAAPRRIEVRWPVTGDADAPWTIESRVDDSEWRFLETRTADPDGSLRIVDARVAPGHAYAYRASWRDEYDSYTSTLATTTTPAQPGYSFDGVSPNPNTGVFAARLEIPEAGMVRLDVLDIAGRVVASQSRWLDAGRHTQPLAREGSLAPGIYTVRMRYRGLVSWSRVIVVR